MLFILFSRFRLTGNETFALQQLFILMHVSSSSPGGWRCGRAFAADDIMSLTERGKERSAARCTATPLLTSRRRWHSARAERKRQEVKGWISVTGTMDLDGGDGYVFHGLGLHLEFIN